MAPGFSDRDRMVVNTPDYYDSKIFYIDADESGNAYKLKRSSKLNPPEEAKIHHGSPLSIVLNGVTLPPLSPGEKRKAPLDIAVVVELGTSVGGKSAPLIAWYQRGVQPDQTLNFANLLIHFESRWDSRLSPFVRIRVIDVTTEKNQETRDAISQATKFSGGLDKIFPGLDPLVIGIAKNAASLVLSNNKNKQLLDFTAQFYSSETITSSFGADLPPLIKGRFLLVGRPKNTSSDYWNHFNGSFNGATNLVQNDGQPIASPVVTMTISVAQTIVPEIVATRSVYLTNLLSQGTQADLNAINNAATALYNGTRTYVAIERLRRNRDSGSLITLIELEQQDGPESISEDDKILIRAILTEISTVPCVINSYADVTSWLSANENKLKFAKNYFKLENSICF